MQEDFFYGEFMALNGNVTTTEELERKTINAVCDIVDKSNNGRLDKLATITALRAIYDCVGGLVPEGTMELLNQSISVCESDCHEYVSFGSHHKTPKGFEFILLVDLFSNQMNLFFYSPTSGKFTQKQYNTETLAELITKHKALWEKIKKWD